MRTLTLVALALLVGCATPPPALERPLRRTWRLDHPPERVWHAAMRSVLERGGQVLFADRQEGVLTAEEVLDAGEVGRYAAERGAVPGGLVRIGVLMEPAERGGTHLFINVVILPLGRGLVRLTSNGKLEAEYVQLIRAHLEGHRYEWLEPRSPAPLEPKP